MPYTSKMTKKKRKSKDSAKKQLPTQKLLKLPYKTSSDNPYFRPPKNPKHDPRRFRNSWTFSQPRPPRTPPQPRESVTISKRYREQQNIGLSTWRAQPDGDTLIPGPKKGYHFSVPKPKGYSTSVTKLPPSRTYDIIKSGKKRFILETNPIRDMWNRESHRRMRYHETKGSNYRKPIKRHPRFARRNRYSRAQQDANRRRNQKQSDKSSSSSKRPKSKKKRKKSTKPDKPTEKLPADNRQTKEQFEKKQKELEELEYSLEDYTGEGEADHVTDPEVNLS